MKTIITTALICTPALLHSQKSTLDNRELLVQKEYSNEIYSVNPVFDYASIFVPRRSNLDFSKDTLSRTFTPDINVAIRPVPYKALPESDGHRGFIKLDKGTLNPLHAQAGYSYSAPNYFNINGAFNYDQRNEKTTPLKTIKAIDALLGIEYYLTKEIKTEISLNYNNNSYGLYGSSELMDGTEDNNTTGYTTIGLDVGLQTIKSSPSNWNYGILASIAEWKDTQLENKEQNIDVLGSIDWYINDTWGMSLSPGYQISDSKEYSTNSVISGAYQITFNEADFYTKAGLKLDYFNSELMLWPDADIRWDVGRNTDINIISSTQTSILGAQYLTNINPYQNTSTLIDQDKIISYDRNLGINIASDLPGDVSLAVRVGYTKAINNTNYRLSPSDLRTFEVAGVDFELLSISSQVNKSIFEQYLSTGLSLTYNNYTKQSASLYHRPILSASPYVESSLLNQKLNLSLSAIINSPQDLASTPSLNLDTGWRKNLSFSLSYRIMDQLNLNFDADNIFNDQYQVWNGYDNFGRNLSGGLLFKF